MARDDDRLEKARVEPIYAALTDREAPTRTGSSGLGWKLLWAALVLLALVAVVLNQAF